jgi:hypothetical protein
MLAAHMADFQVRVAAFEADTSVNAWRLAS